MSKVLDILESLVNTPAVSGFERELGMSQRIVSFFKSFNPQVDELGNVLVKVSSGKKRILIEAHLDEVGFLKTANGFVTIGSISEKDIKSENITTVKGKRISYFKRQFNVTGTIVKSPGLDNKTGCTALVLAANNFRNLNADVWLAFTAREETTCEGIKKIVDKIKPNIIISVDSAYAQPFENKRWQIPICGNGPAMQLQGMNFIINCIDLIEDVAKNEKIPYQFEIVDYNCGATNLSDIYSDAQKIQINIPVKYQHTAICEADIRDIENAAKLVVAVVTEIEEEIKNENK